MWSRTITIGSAGKTFSVTGWKVGWAFGDSELMRTLRLMHELTTDTTNTPIQEALAIAFEHEIDNRSKRLPTYWSTLNKELLQKRDKLSKALVEIGLRPTVPDGGYFMLVDMSLIVDKVDLTSESGDTSDRRLVKWLIKNKVSVVSNSNVKLMSSISIVVQRRNNYL